MSGILGYVPILGKRYHGGATHVAELRSGATAIAREGMVRAESRTSAGRQAMSALRRKAMKSFALLIPTIAAMLIAAGAGTTAQDEAPKPSVTVAGTCVYLDRGRENITVSLTKVEEPKPEGQEPEKDPPKPQTAKTNKDGVFEFKSVPIGKYQLTAKGSPQGSIRAYKETAPVDVEVTADTKSPVEKEITLTLDRAR
jgi:hypothetical protein